MDQHNIIVHHRSPVAANIALFRSLFRGREDIYPRRFESFNTNFNSNSELPRVYATRKTLDFTR
jgi:hypothetical protein